MAIVVSAGLGLGAGLALSVFLAKYRDLTNLIQLTVRLLMFATPVIYPLSIVPEKIKVFMVYNPLVPVIEFFRVAFLGQGTTSGIQVAYSLASVIVFFFAGSILFNKMGSKLIDVV